jgi:hypothetical protein
MLLTLTKWFASLSADNKNALIQGVMRSIMQMDPQFEQCAAMWARGKTSRMEAKVPIGNAVRQIGIHFNVEDADLRLLHLFLQRVVAGNLDFQPGRAAPVKGELMDGFLASLGKGTVWVREVRKELMITVSNRQVVPIPDQMAVGAPMPIPTPPEEGFRVLLFEGQFLLVGNLTHLQQHELAAAEHQPISLGLVPVSPHLFLLMLSIPILTQGWADIPFALGLEQPENRRLVVPEANGASSMLLAIVERETGLVEVMRPLALSPRFTADLHQAIEDQQDALAGFSVAHFEATLTEARRRWPSPNDVPRGYVEVVQ